MPQFIMDALVAARLRERYYARPAYQQNDYVGWITRAKQDLTRQRRLAQMLAELKDGRLYMKMKHKPKEESRDGARGRASRKKA